MLRSPRYHTSGKYPLAFSGSCYFYALHAFCSRVILNLKYDGYRANSPLVLGDVESVSLACVGAHGKLVIFICICGKFEIESEIESSR